MSGSTAGPQSAPGTPGKKPGGCLGTVVALIAVGALISMCDGGGSGSSAGNEYGAKDACHQWIKDQLKSPASADFSGETVSGDDPWTITGSVDAENSFGANLRKSWTCTVSTSGDKYTGNATLFE